MNHFTSSVNAVSVLALALILVSVVVVVRKVEGAAP